MNKDKIWASYFGGAERLRGKVRGVDLTGKREKILAVLFPAITMEGPVLIFILSF